MTISTIALASRGLFPLGLEHRAMGPDASSLPGIDLRELARQVCVGDVVFIRVAALPFRKVAAVTGSWTNHVGVIVETDGCNPLVAEVPSRSRACHRSPTLSPAPLDGKWRSRGSRLR